MSSFYGDIKVNPQISLVFDKTYPNRKAMEEAIQKNNLDGSSTGNINGDGVYNTRYVFINYGERRYSSYHLAEIQSSWYTVENGKKYFKSISERPRLFIYQIGTNTLTTNKSLNVDLKTRPYGIYKEIDSGIVEYEPNNRYYIATDKLAGGNIISPDGIDENCEYAINREIDENEYQSSYDHTVWQKIWCSVGTSSTITEKYIMVASLDAKAPRFEVIIDAPASDDGYEVINYIQSDGTRIPITPLGIYYTLNTKTNKYESLDLNCINQWNKGIEKEKIDFPANSDKNIYQGEASFQYKEILSDIIEYVPLQKNGNQIITGKEMLDIYLNSVGNIYKKIERNNVITYTPVPVGSKFEETDSDNSVVRYCHKTTKDPGYISEDLFARLFNTSQSLYYYDTQTDAIVQVKSIDEYDSDTKYYRKVSLKHGPHIDPLRSTDLNYKLHIPRNWKFNPIPEFKYNKKGFSPTEQHETNGENQIHLQKTSSNSLYPVHMDEFGRKLYTKNTESGTIKGEIATEVNIPEAGYYINNELQYAEQLDQQTFYIDLPELGNMASQIWDIVYPRGKFIKYPIKGSITYDDKEYTAGHLYYKEDETKEQYTLIGKNEPLDSRQTYYIFVRENEDGTPVKTRYMFIGNDRDPKSTAKYPEAYPEGYPKTFGEAIRYIYRLLGLESDNDYLDNFSENTIWGMWNGLRDLLGNYKDIYDTDNFIPIKSHPSTVSGFPSRPVFSYGNARDLVFGYLSGDWFKKLNNAAFGPLYEICSTKDYIIQIQANTEIEPNSSYRYYIYDSNTNSYILAGSEGIINEFEPGQTYYYRVNRKCTNWIIVDKSQGVKKGLQYYLQIKNNIYERINDSFEQFNPELEYYIPQIEYKKAEIFNSTTQYYRNMNSLWALLNEFQKNRDEYQADWIKDNPGSPTHIVNRPKIIFSDLDWTDKYGDYDNKLDFVYEIIEDINSDESLAEYLTDEKFKEIGNIYYQEQIKIGETIKTVYIKVSKDSKYNNKYTYFKITKPIDVNLSDYSIGTRWSGIKVNRQNTGKIVNYNPNSGTTDTQTITLEELTPKRLAELINIVESE